MNNNLKGIRHQRGLRMWMNAAVIAISIFILLLYMLSCILFSFNLGVGAGLRSLAAAVLPFTVLMYLRLFTNFLKQRRRVPLFNLYFLFTVWTIFLFGFAQSLYGLAFPIGELLFSVTLAATSWRYGSHSVSNFLSCCYDIITGSLIYVIFAGFPLSIQ
ncbi:MAG: hypothetical protein AAF959_00440 [Cyanobacteria bacterium P01_D01_bin.56]